VFQRAAAEKGATLVPVAGRTRVRFTRPEADGTEVRLESRDFGPLHFRLRALGRHQAGNAALAVAALGVALERGLRTPAGEPVQGEEPSREKIESALTRARWPGRLERSEREPRVWWDGAHNPHGARVLRRAWSDALGDAPAAVVLGCSSDKDVDGFLHALQGPWTYLFAAAPNNPRALDPGELARRASRWGVPTSIRASVADATLAALETVGRQGRVLITGSLFTVGEAMTALQDPPPEALP
jgi:dihydrofolate synthase/folylpolyglutamate synthase